MLVLLSALILADWGATVLVVIFCFSAFGDPIGLGVLITGFAVGIAVGLFSMIPGGLRAQEASMAGIYSLLGIPLEQAVLVSLLFRLVYYFVPFGVSLVLYRRLLN